MMRGSYRCVLCTFGVLLVALAGCAGEPPLTSKEVPQESRVSTEETTEEVERLDVRDAVGQLFVVGMDGTAPNYHIEEMVGERNIGGVLLLGHNMESEEQTRELADSLQHLSMETQPATPLFVAVDHEGGEVQGAPWVPAQASAAEVGGRADPEEARRISERIGGELRRGGVNTNLAPVVDTGSGAAIGSRSYGDDSALVALMGAAAVGGFKEAGIVSAAKHFPNHGPALKDSHIARPVVDHDVETVVRSDLAPFRAAVEPERPASLSPAAVWLLRDELGFNGVIVTDDLVMEGARRGGTTAEAALRAVEVGVDLLIISGPPEEQAAAYDGIVAAVESGSIARERIDASVERIERVKDRYQIFGEVR